MDKLFTFLDPRDRNPLFYIGMAAVLLLTIFTLAGCDSNTPWDTYAKTDLEYAPARRDGWVQGPNTVTILLRTQQGWYVKVLSVSPGECKSFVGRSEQSKFDKNKGYSGTINAVVTKVPDDCKIIELKVQYCSATSCRRETIQVEIQ